MDVKVTFTGGLSVGIGEDHKAGAVEHVGVVFASTSSTTQVALLDVLQHLKRSVKNDVFVVVCHCVCCVYNSAGSPVLEGLYRWI